MDFLEQTEQLYMDWQNILVAPPKNPSAEDLESSLALFYTLKKLGKKVNILIDGLEQNIQPSLSNAEPNSIKEFVVSIDASDKEITEMRYEKNKNRLDVHLSLKKGEIRDTDISLTQPCENEEQKILVVSGLKKTDTQQKNSLQRIPKIKLLSRVLHKLEIDRKKNIYSACIKASDFLSSAAQTKDLGFVIGELKKNTWKLPSLLLLWEENSSLSLVRGVFYSSNKDFIGKVLENFPGVLKGDGILFSVKENDIKKVKEKILDLL